ncbi:GLPGLI family protein [Flavobacterium sp. 2755]|uniref:GLPGLI family protein n=1 Tax=Flavobacterium sp. 2755 TaxID=2817765 RepID=UPI0028627AFA|nr:GLPGLI family protein [Flavobacterium sp. 2755]MDR6761093.1 GLPGLI family protein [Flavobacterium sp. 2755]
MKKLSYLLLIFAFTQVHAQKDFQGMAVYESKTQPPKFEGMRAGNRDITPEMQKSMEERMKQMLEKTFILNFDKTASIYKEEEKLETPGQQGGFRVMMSSMMGGGGTFYKDVKAKSYTVDKEFMGKEFLVVDSLPKLNWKLEQETKQIGGYNCFKASAVKEASKTDFRNFRPKNNDKKDEAKKTSGETKTNFEDNFEIPKEITVTAWYTPEIPVNQGPENYWGLPGLILEVNDGKTVILCSKIVLNAKEKAEIKPSKKGKVVSQKEYDETVIKKMEEFREMSRGRTSGPAMPMGR